MMWYCEMVMAVGVTPGGAEVPSYGWAAAKMLIALVVVVAGLLIAVKLMPRWMGKRGAVGAKGEIEVVASCVLEPRRVLYIVRVRGREYLVGSSEQGLHAMSGGPLDGRSGPAFAEVLAGGKVEGNVEGKSGAAGGVGG